METEDEVDSKTQVRRRSRWRPTSWEQGLHCLIPVTVNRAAGVGWQRKDSGTLELLPRVGTTGRACTVKWRVKGGEVTMGEREGWTRRISSVF